MFNVIRPENIPPSLSLKRDYDGKDVYEALLDCFHKKCYLCERKEPGDINVEHFHPHKGDKNKKFSWDNLYLACSRCNNIKLAEFDNLLDCCDPSIDVALLVRMIPPITPYTKKVIIEGTSTDIKTINTVKLLDKIFNSDHTVNKEISGSFLRRKIYDAFECFNEHIRNYFARDATRLEKEKAIEKMQVLASSEAEFSAFIKHSILDDEELSKLVFK